MATFYPTIDKIKTFKVQPTSGELALLNFLEKNLDDTFQVYFNPTKPYSVSTISSLIR